MPQPLKRVTPKSGFTLCNAGDRLSDRNPALAVLVMEAIVSWTNVENFMLGLYLQLMGEPSDLASIAFLALESQKSKYDVLKAIAREKLIGDELKVFDAILFLTKSYQKERDKLVHWSWGYTDNLPDHFLLGDPRKIVPILSARPPKHTGQNISIWKETLTAYHEKKASVSDHLFAYSENDFKNIIRKNDRLCYFGLELQHIINCTFVEVRKSKLRQLCAQSEIQERLDRQA